MVKRDIFKNRHYICHNDRTHLFIDMRWLSDPLPSCPICNCLSTEEEGSSSYGRAPSVIGDEIDIQIRHGLCNPDGSPRRFRSMTDLRKAAQDKGLTIAGETPNPTSQQREQQARFIQETNERRYGKG